jgi:hypothetical protein
VEFPPDITAEVVSDSNPHGKLTNSDLEMAGVLLHYLALEQLVPNLVHTQAVVGCDNLRAVAWTQHGHPCILPGRPQNPAGPRHATESDTGSPAGYFFTHQVRAIFWQMLLLLLFPVS